MLGEFETERQKQSSSEQVTKAKVTSNAFFSQAMIEKLQTKGVELKSQRKQMKKMKNAYVEYADHDVCFY
jgi:hypothetical protein